ncbi:MAG: HAD family hydrolase, partial [Dermatophilaceae bacterium]|nr:HAD family hydrolase [Dermatophilaceae bacterium]
GVDGPSDLMATQAAPTYVLGSLADLFEPYAAPVERAGRWRCGAATARFTDGELRLGADGASTVEAVRAGIAALLAERAAGRSRDELARAAAASLDPLL